MDILRRSLQPGSGAIVKTDEFINRNEDDGSLGSGEDATSLPTGLLETSMDTNDTDDVQYKFIDENVTYRVVQFAENVDISTNPAPAAATPASDTLSGGSSPQNTTIYTGPLNGVYVINSSEVFPVNNAKTVVRTAPSNKPPPPSRDDKRRATHNEVERRRRDKINNWIMKLGKIIPECKSDSSKGTYEMSSKGGILAKACDYITELRETNDRLLVFVKENQQLLSDVQSLDRQLEDLRRENEQLRELLTEHGIPTSL